ncbi:MAG: ATP-binding cassette domain-containing protein, partial [Treponema sp.]|nr:ATP-binding cassette domain-containing protein [Treponema sp.]
MAAIIELKNISFTAQGRKLVKNAYFQFEEGKTIALIGQSGCGKSTLLKLSAGLIVPDEGEILYKGKNIFRMNRLENLSFRCESAVVFQDSALWANQNLYQTLELPLQLHFPEMTKNERDEKIKAMALLVGYRKDLLVRPSQLSMGEQKLIAFARAMICKPKLLYLDEWTESLDESASQRLIGIVKKIQNEGITIIMITHKVSIIQDIANEAVIIIEGK